MTKEEYLQDPCGAASIPYWKIQRFPVPAGIWIVHDRGFQHAFLEYACDVLYFRLKHDLQDLEPVTLPDCFAWYSASCAEYAAHINSCYGTGCVSEDSLRDYTAREVYCPELWIAVRDSRAGEIAASGIAEVDREIGECALEWIQVSPKYRGQGLGSCVVRELLWRAKTLARFATVSGQCENPANPERLYRRCGFTGKDIWHVLTIKTEKDHTACETADK